MSSTATMAAELAAPSTSAAEKVQVDKGNVSEVDKTPQDEALLQSVWADEPEEVVGTGDPSESPPKSWDEFEARSTGSPSKTRPHKASEEGNSRHDADGPQGSLVQEPTMPDSRASLVPVGAEASSNVTAPVVSGSTSNGKQQESEKDSLESVNTPAAKVQKGKPASGGLCRKVPEWSSWLGM